MNTNIIEFNLSDSDHSKAFAMLVKNLNESGVPYNVRTEMDILRVAVEISDGFWLGNRWKSEWVTPNDCGGSLGVFLFLFWFRGWHNLSIWDGELIRGISVHLFTNSFLINSVDTKVNITIIYIVLSQIYSP